jgi:hypothetical protein
MSVKMLQWRVSCIILHLSYYHALQILSNTTENLICVSAQGVKLNIFWKQNLISTSDPATYKSIFVGICVNAQAVKLNIF